MLIIRPEISYFGLKRRIIPFNEAHELEYSLEIASRNGISKEVNLVRCKLHVIEKKRRHSSMKPENDRIYTVNQLRVELCRHRLLASNSAHAENNICTESKLSYFQ